MSFRVEIKRTAEKELANLTQEAQQRIAKALMRLVEQPFPAGFKKLKGSTDYRIRIGDYRILYTVDTRGKSVFVFAIGHRREVYR